jgi:hypothetical protein
LGLIGVSAAAAPAAQAAGGLESSTATMPTVAGAAQQGKRDSMFGSQR